MFDVATGELKKKIELAEVIPADRKQDSKCYNGEEHEVVTRVEPCTCNDMDFECDIGYARENGSGPCLLEQVKISDAEK